MTENEMIEENSPLIYDSFLVRTKIRYYYYKYMYIKPFFRSINLISIYKKYKLNKKNKKEIIKLDPEMIYYFKYNPNHHK